MAAALAAAASCSTKADEEPPAESTSGPVKTGPGIEGNVITLVPVLNLDGVGRMWPVPDLRGVAGRASGAGWPGSGHGAITPVSVG
ncbi:hypothetical protein AB1484_05490, partial [Parafrankia sp. FMc6]